MAHNRAPDPMNVNFKKANVSDNGRIVNVQNNKGGIRFQSPGGSSSGVLKKDKFFSNVPYPVVQDYVDRPALYNQIRQQLQKPASSSKIVVIQGLGGAGKTQLTLQYLDKHKSEYRGVFWISLVSKQSVEAEVGAIYRYMYGSDKKDSRSFNEMLVAIKNWFHGQSGQWLWMLDNADNVEDPRDPEFIDLVQLIPQTQSVHTVITTRSRAVADLTSCKAIVVEGMEPHQALDLFWKSSKIRGASSENTRIAKRLLKSFDHLALAITISGATVSESRSMSANLQKYVDVYSENKKELLERYPNQITTRYNASILSSWETSYRIIKRRSPPAAKLLGFISLLNPNDISPDLFENALEIRDSQVASSLKGVKWQPVIGYPKNNLSFRTLEADLSTLESYSLLKFTNRKKTYVMHKLIHEWGYERLERESRLQYGWSVCAFESLLVGGIPDKSDSRVRLGEHIFQSFNKTSKLILDNAALAWFVHQWETQGMFLQDYGLWRNCATMQTLILHTRRELSGQDHKDTINAMNNLATTLGKQRKHQEAATMMKEVVRKRIALLGDMHPETISALSNYAGILKLQGKSNEAVEIQKQVLQKRITVFGKDHPSILSTWSNIAATLTDMGKLDEAVQIQREVLGERTRIFGKNDRETTTATNNLGVTLGRMNKSDESTKALREVIQQRKNDLGPEHPETLAAMGNLAVTLGNQASNGNHDLFEEAAKVLEQVLKLQRKTLGDKHPHTVRTEQNLRATRHNVEAVAKNKAANRK